MNLSNNLLVFILALSFLMFTHELGHFLVGKLFKIEAEEFGFGYPPRLIKLFNWGKTEFTLNWIPFGAFVRFKGEDDPNSEGGFYSANKWQRLATLFAGPGMNILVGILLFSLVISKAGYAKTDVIQVAAISADSPAASAGIQAGDELLAINGQSVANMSAVNTIVKDNLDKPVELSLLRDSKNITLSVVPRSNPPKDQGAIGIVMAYPIEYHSFLQSIPLGAQTAWEQIVEIFQLPRS
jgi:regulator of sigma E protease